MKLSWWKTTLLAISLGMASASFAGVNCDDQPVIRPIPRPGQGLHLNPRIPADACYLTVLLYQAILAREPDPQGLNNWADYIVRGGRQGLENAAKGMGDSQEARELLYNMGDTMWIDNLYYVMLQRPGEPSGLDAWIRELHRSGPGVVARGFTISNEFRRIYL
jgi:hypothetical protein